MSMEINIILNEHGLINVALIVIKQICESSIQIKNYSTLKLPFYRSCNPLHINSQTSSYNSDVIRIDAYYR